MEYYHDFNMTTNEYTITSSKGEMINFGFGVVLWIWAIWFAIGWCRDPLATEMEEKIHRLNEQIDGLNNHLESSQEECDFLRERLSSASHHIRALRRLLDTETESDGDSVSSRKRPRCNT